MTYHKRYIEGEPIYIYAYENKIDGKIYIGQSIDVAWRDYQHIYNKETNMHIDNAIRKYGRENFDLWVFNITYSGIEADIVESYWTAEMKRLLGSKMVYNIADFAGAPMRGKRHTLEAKIKMSISRKGKKRSEEIRQKMIGRHHTEETKNKISEAHKNKPKSQDHKQKMRKPKSEEAKKNMSIARTGVKLSEEHKQKMSIAVSGEKNHFFGKHHSEETLEKLRKPKSEEHKQKLSIAKTGSKRSEEEKQLRKDNRSDYKFSIEQERQIYEEKISGKTQKVLAEKYGCSIGTIRLIVRRNKPVI